MPFKKGQSGNEDAKFKKGQSGNPAGKPKGVEHSTTRIAKLLQYVKRETNKATGETSEFSLMELADAAIAARAMDGDVIAYRELLDRFEGKVPQRNEHSGPEGNPIQFDTNAPLADKLAALEALKKIQNKEQ